MFCLTPETPRNRGPGVLTELQVTGTERGQTTPFRGILSLSEGGAVKGCPTCHNLPKGGVDHFRPCTLLSSRAGGVDTRVLRPVHSTEETGVQGVVNYCHGRERDENGNHRDSTR